MTWSNNTKGYFNKQASLFSMLPSAGHTKENEYRKLPCVEAYEVEPDVKIGEDDCLFNEEAFTTLNLISVV